MPFLLSNKNPYPLSSEKLGYKIIETALAHIGRHCWQIAVAKPSAQHVFSSVSPPQFFDALLPQYCAPPFGGVGNNSYEYADSEIADAFLRAEYQSYFERIRALDERQSRTHNSPHSYRIHTKRDFYAAFLFNDPNSLKRFEDGNDLFINCEEFIYFIFYKANIFSIDGLRMLAHQSADFKSVLWRNCKRRFMLQDTNRPPQNGDLIFFYEKKTLRYSLEEFFHHIGIYRHYNLCIGLGQNGDGPQSDFSVSERNILCVCQPERTFFIVPPHIFIREMLELLGSNKYRMTEEEIEEIQKTSCESARQ